MKRWVAICIVAMLCAVGLQIHRATEPVSVVYACSYSVEHSNTASTQFWSPYFAAYDVLYARVTTYAGNAGSGYGCSTWKEYNVQQWTALGTPGSYYSEVRVWVCGSARGPWASNSSSVWSAAYDYTIYCGRQADDNGSYFHVSASGQNVGVYVNQG